MPELSNIQTFEKIEGTNFLPTLGRFSKVLKTLGLWNNEVATAFDSFEWKVEDNGFVYSSGIGIDYLSLNSSQVRIRPLFSGYTADIDQTFEENWFGCQLLIPTEDLRDFGNLEYNSYTFDIVKLLSEAMHKEFKQTGVYFTDEAQDGEDFDGLRCDNTSFVWQFDYALIPMNLKHFYENLPDTHCMRLSDTNIEAWKKDVWKMKLSH